MSYNIPDHLKGLNDNEVAASQKKYGYNRIDTAHKNTGLELLLNILKEPMLILLFAISAIYLITGDYGEALFMFVAIIAVSAISLYQDTRSKKALEALEKLNKPLSKVIHNAKVVEKLTKEIESGDVCITEEGKMINADRKIMHSNNFSVNEVSLTGESLSVFKNSEIEDNIVNSGSLAVSRLTFFEE